MDRQHACPDDGTCHHDCPLVGPCFRVLHAGPLSGVYPGDTWPEQLRFDHAAHRSTKEPPAPWTGVIAVEGVPTGDRRRMRPAVMRFDVPRGMHPSRSVPAFLAALEEMDADVTVTVTR